MEVKDWILLFIPIIFNGVIIFILQKNFEKKLKLEEFSISEKYKYVSTLRSKIDIALDLYMKVIQSKDDIQYQYLNKYIDTIQNIFYYYQQNKNIFENITQYMDEMIENYNHAKELIDNHLLEKKDNIIIFEDYLNNTYYCLQNIKKDCIDYKV